MIPKQVLECLAEGNRRFMEGRPEEKDHRARVRETAGGQSPFAAVLGCIDSRVPAELIFDQGIGDIFNVRIAGNIVNSDILGSLEFACSMAGAGLILVLGHSGCGAVTAACERMESGHLTPLLDRIRPAVESVDKESSQARADVDLVAQRNVRQSIDTIRRKSSILAGMEKRAEILITGAFYDVSSGEAAFME